VLAEINNNSEFRAAAATAAVRQLTFRQQFLGKKYRGLLDQCRELKPLDLPDETVLMLVCPPRDWG